MKVLITGLIGGAIINASWGLVPNFAAIITGAISMGIAIINSQE